MARCDFKKWRIAQSFTETFYHIKTLLSTQKRFQLKTTQMDVEMNWLKYLAENLPQ